MPVPMGVPMRVIDSHCHLELADFGPDEAAREQVIERARQAGVAHFVAIGSGSSLAYVETAVGLAERYADFSAAVAIHPHDVKDLTEGVLGRIEALACGHTRVVAVGETGLDYHYNHSPPPRQQEAFRQFIAIARRAQKPLTLHIRDAHADAQTIFEEESGRDVGAVVHCFTGTVEEARHWLDLGCYLSFSGILTFKSADELRRAAAFAPPERVMVETDCPYLAPLPYRGKRNEPAYVIETLKVLAAVRGVEAEAAAESTTRAAVAAFRLPVGHEAPSVGVS